MGSSTESSSNSMLVFSVDSDPPQNRTSLSRSPESARIFKLLNVGLIFNGNIGEMSAASTVRL